MSAMHVHRIVSIVIGLMLVLVSGCDRKPSVANNTTPASPASTGAISNENLIARFHWLGKSRLAGETNAARFMSIWNMPESAALENQTLNKLALAPWRLTKGDAATNGAPTAQMRGLLDDLVQAEWYIEVVRDVANQPAQVALAVRMDSERAALWKTNLASVVESLCENKISAETDGWSLHYKTPDPRPQTPDSGLLQFVRAGDWTLVGLAHGKNALLGEFKTHIGRDHAPYAARTTNFWFDANVDLVQLNDALGLGWKLPADLPRIKLTGIGDGENVRTRGELMFPKPLDLKIEPWNIPTNLIHDPLVGFSAVRALSPMLKSFGMWNESKLGPMPGQAYFWAQDGLPPLHFAAAPALQASNQFHLLSALLLQTVNPRIGYLSRENELRMGSLYMDTNSPSMRWRGFPYFSPQLTWVESATTPFLTGGLFSNALTNRTAPAALFQQFTADADLVYYDWEETQSCVASWTQVSQVFRMVLDRSRLRMKENASWPWMAAVATNIQTSVTTLRIGKPDSLMIARNSTIGFTGIELHLLADWLESPRFPVGFFTVLAPLAKSGELPKPSSTNAPSQ